MELTIISPTQKKTLSIAWLEINTMVGNFVIQPGHASTVLVLEPQQAITYCLDSGKQESSVIPSGIVEITPDSATIVMHGN